MAALVAPESDSSDNDALFQGTKFFVSQRIPERTRLIEMIKDNGGNVVTLECRADYIIANHQTNDPLPNSVSFKYIEDTVQARKRPNINEYMAESTIVPSSEFRPRRSGKTRNHFTKADDQILIQWCALAHKNGESLGGNKVFQKLERSHPNHSYQSWKDRWKKHVSKRVQPQNHDEQIADQDQALRHTQQKKTESLSTNVPPSSPDQIPDTIRKTTQDRKQERETQSNDLTCTHKLPHSNEGHCFTQEDIDILVNECSRIVQVDRRNMINFWESWARKNTRHSPQEWFNYFEDFVLPIQKASAKKDNSLPEIYSEDIDASVESSMKDKVVNSSFQSSSNNLSQNAILIQKASTEKSGSLLRNHSEPIETTQSSGIVEAASLDPQSIDNLCQSHFSSESLALAMPQTINYEEHYKEMMRRIEDPLAFPDPMIRDKKLFELGIKELAEELGLEINLAPQISGKTVSLFGLWRVVQPLENLTFDSDDSGYIFWKIISKLLGIKNCDNSVIIELKNCYYETLAGFQRLRHEFLVETGQTKSQKQHLSEDQIITITKGPNIEPDYVKIEEDSSLENHLKIEDESPPQTPHRKSNLSKKRSQSFDTGDKNFTRKKRRRIGSKRSRTQEIPPTPEHIIAGNRGSSRCTIQVVIENKISPTFHGSNKNKNQHTKYREQSLETIKPRDLDENKSSLANNLVHAPPALETNDHITEVLTQTTVIESPKQPLSHNTAENRLPSPTQINSQPNSRQCNSTSKAIERMPLDDARPALPQEAEAESSSEDELNNYITDMVANFGYPESVVIEALEATTMTIGAESHIRQVMESLSQGKGIPKNLRGVWTEKDDEALELSSESIGYKQVMNKHGSVLVQQRKEFKNYARNALED